VLGPGSQRREHGALLCGVRRIADRSQLVSSLCRWCSFGSAVAGTDANITFYEYGQDGSVLHQTPTKIKVPAVRCIDGGCICREATGLWQYHNFIS